MRGVTTAALTVAMIVGGLSTAGAQDREIDTWAEFAEDLQETRAAVRAFDATLDAGLDRAAECRYATSDGSFGWSTADVRRTIGCAVAKWSVPRCSRDNGCSSTGLAKALAVASCESGADLMHPREPGGYSGTYQQSETYWPGRQDAFGPRAWDKPIPESSGIPRANVVVSIRMAHSGAGWGPWESGRCA